MRSDRDLTTRLNTSNLVTKWGQELRDAVPSRLQHNAADPTSRERLHTLWRTAAKPTRRSLEPSPTNLAAVQTALQEPLELIQVETRHSGTGDGANHTDDGPFAPMTDQDYEAAVASHEAGELQEVPLNPEQRQGGHNFLKLAQLRAVGRANGHSSTQIATDAKQQGLSQVTLVVGAGGTGKSAMIHALKREFERHRLGGLLVTAYTGVAAAPFGGPTLMKLLKMSLKDKSSEDVRRIDQQARENRRQKFIQESGYSPEDLGGIVVDEVSFIELSMFGHLDSELRSLMGPNACELCCGGLPMLLCGDPHQKPPPGGTPWHTIMTQVNHPK